MYVVRNVFRTKPGKAKALVAKFKDAAPHLTQLGVKSTRILTDVSATFWTVVVESETDDLSGYLEMARGDRGEAAGKALAGYMDLVEGGHREVFKIE